jgi:rubrerythrin
MTERETSEDRALIAELNDLLRLNHDALQAYGVAIRSLRSDSRRQAVESFREDHQRHVAELSQLVREYGGTPAELPHLPTGAFKLAVQAIGAAGGDRAILLAFKANERQSRDRYRAAAAQPLPAGVAAVLSRHAVDEVRHYAWALTTLDDLGAGADTISGSLERVVEIGSARMADAVESVERHAFDIGDAARRGIRARVRQHPIETALIALSAGFLVGQLVGRESPED